MLKIIGGILFIINFSLVQVYADNGTSKIPKRFMPEDEIRRLNSSDERGLDFDAVIKKMTIKPGMSIVDIGAGTGIFTLRFAKALDNTGKVYATEINPEKVEYICDAGLKSGYSNIESVLVDKDGVDPFYSSHIFDIVFMCETITNNRNFGRYFDQLRPFINKNKGRLYIVDFDDDTSLQSFGEEDIDDFEAFVRNIISWKESPLYKRLSPQTQDLIGHWDNQSVIPADKRQVIRKDINLIFSDRLLLGDMYDYLSRNCVDKDSCLSPLLRIMTMSEFELIRWMYSELDAALIYDSEKIELSASQRKDINTINYIILFRMLKPNSQENPFYEKSYSPFFTTRKNSVISKLKAVGYELINDYYLPKRYFLEFKRKI